MVNDRPQSRTSRTPLDRAHDVGTRVKHHSASIHELYNERAMPTPDRGRSFEDEFFRREDQRLWSG
jgi:hypothetical protein